MMTSVTFFIGGVAVPPGTATSPASISLGDVELILQDAGPLLLLCPGSLLLLLVEPHLLRPLLLQQPPPPLLLGPLVLQHPLPLSNGRFLCPELGLAGRQDGLLVGETLILSLTVLHWGLRPAPTEGRVETFHRAAPAQPTLPGLLVRIRPLHGEDQTPPSFLDEVDGVVHVVRDLAVDHQDLVVLLQSRPLALTPGNNLSYEDTSLVLLVLVQTFVDQGQPEPL